MNTFSTKQFFDKKDYHKIMIKQDAWECRKRTVYFEPKRKEKNNLIFNAYFSLELGPVIGVKLRR